MAIGMDFDVPSGPSSLRPKGKPRKKRSTMSMAHTDLGVKKKKNPLTSASEGLGDLIKSGGIKTGDPIVSSKPVVPKGPDEVTTTLATPSSVFEEVMGPANVQGRDVSRYDVAGKKQPHVTAQATEENIKKVEQPPPIKPATGGDASGSGGIVLDPAEVEEDPIEVKEDPIEVKEDPVEDDPTDTSVADAAARQAEIAAKNKKAESDAWWERRDIEEQKRNERNARKRALAKKNEELINREMNAGAVAEDIRLEHGLDATGASTTGTQGSDASGTVDDMDLTQIVSNAAAELDFDEEGATGGGARVEEDEDTVVSSDQERWSAWAGRADELIDVVGRFQEAIDRDPTLFSGENAQGFAIGGISIGDLPPPVEAQLREVIAEAMRKRSRYTFENQAAGDVLASEDVRADTKELVDKALQGSDTLGDEKVRSESQGLLRGLLAESEGVGRDVVDKLSVKDVTDVNVPDRPITDLERAIEQKVTGRLDAPMVRDLTEGTTSAERIIRERLEGGDNPALEALRARIRKRYGESEEEGREMLNRMGVLRSGDTADIFNRLAGDRDLALADVDAQGFDLQTQAIADALGYQDMRNERQSENERLKRAAIADALGFGQYRDDRDFREADITGQLRGAATLGARQSQADLGLRAAGLEQDVADRALARRMPLTGPTGRETFEESLRSARFDEGIAEGDLTGRYTDEEGVAGKTIRGRAMDLDEQRRLDQVNQERMARELAIGEALGEFGPAVMGKDSKTRTTLAGKEQAQDQAFREAGLTGRYGEGDEATLEGRKVDIAEERSEEDLKDARNRRVLETIAQGLAAKEAGIDMGAQDFDVANVLREILGQDPLERVWGDADDDDDGKVTQEGVEGPPPGERDGIISDATFRGGETDEKWNRFVNTFISPDWPGVRRDDGSLDYSSIPTGKDRFSDQFGQGTGGFGRAMEIAFGNDEEKITDFKELRKRIARIKAGKEEAITGAEVNRYRALYLEMERKFQEKFKAEAATEEEVEF